MAGCTRRMAFAALLSSLAVAAQAQLRELSIPISSTSLGTAAIRVAKELGIFEKHGISPKIIIMDSSSAAMSALISKSVDVVLAGPGELVAAQAKGQSVVAVADAYRGFAGSLVLRKDVADKLNVSPNAPIADRLKALDGLTIAGPSATSAYTVAYKGASEGQGAKIKFTFLAQPVMVAALRARAIDGFIAGAPFWGDPVTKGQGVLWISGPKGELPKNLMPYSSVGLQAMRDFAESHPKLMKDLQAVLADLGKVIETNPAAVKNAVKTLYPEIDDKTLDLYLQTEAPAWNTRPFTVEAMQQEIDFIRAAGSTLDLSSVRAANLFYSAK